MARLERGRTVHTPLGIGIVQGMRGSGYVVVDIRGRDVVVPVSTVSDAADSRRRAPDRPRPAETTAPGAAAALEVDLHGLTVEEALATAEVALNEALLADRPQLRFIHGRGGGRIKAALHRRLRAITAVRAFRLDPRNPGVTVVDL